MKCSTASNVIVIKANGTRVCENKAGDQANCKVFNETDTNCEICNDGSYKSQFYQPHCCNMNSFWDGSACASILNFSNPNLQNAEVLFFDFDGQVTNFECKNTHYKYNNQECLEISPHGTISSCVVSKNNTSCDLCDLDYIKDGSGGCVQKQLSLSNCVYNFNLNNQWECVQCEDGLYLTEGQCCEEGQYFNLTIQKCEQMTKFSTAHCTKHNDSDTCLECNLNQGYYLTNEKCCQIGYYLNGTYCEEIKTSSNKTVHTEDCNFWNTSFECIDIYSEYPSFKDVAYLYSNCKNNKVFINGICCSAGQINQENVCTPVTLSTNCQTMSTSGTSCIECSNKTTHYVSNGNCCTFQSYWNKESGNCVNIDDPDCDQMQFDKVLNRYICTKCDKLTPINQKFPQCCSSKYFTGSACVANIQKCKVMNTDGTCDICLEDYYMSNAICCLPGYYNSGGQCMKIKSSEKCLEKKDGTNCSRCVISKKLLTATNGHCCEEGFSYLNLLNSCVEKAAIEENCYNNGEACYSCKENFHLTQNVCCPIGKYLELIGGVYKCISNSIDNCEVQESTFKCVQCKEEGSYGGGEQMPMRLAGDEFVSFCCPIYTPFINGECSEDHTVQGCENFENGKCMKCQNNQTLNIDENGKSQCCPGDHLLSEQNGRKECHPFNFTITQCQKFNPSDFICDQCNNNFMESHGQCCPDGQFFSMKEQQCAPNFFNFCKQQNEWECLQCLEQNENNTFDLYLSNGYCCPINTFFDKIKNECLPSPNNCKKYNSKDKYCEECDSNEFYLIQKKCCPYFTYWNQINLKCETMINNCKIYEDHFSSEGLMQNDEVLCEKCGPGYSLSKDKKNCCLTFGFYNTEDETCIQNKQMNNIYENCTDWNPLTLNCAKCIENHYLSQTASYSHCCPLGRYESEQTNICEEINTETYPQCNQFSNSSCIGCSEGYQINNSGLCVEVFPNCADFDANAGNCIECDYDYYITNKHCCLQTFYWLQSETSCVNTVPIENCLEYKATDNTKCEICKLGTYSSATQTSCIKNEYFLDGDQEVLGKILNCEQYSTSNTDCIKCKPFFTLQTIQASLSDFIWNNTLNLAAFKALFPSAVKLYCFPIQQKNCLNSEFSIDGLSNKLTCNSCLENYFTDNFSAGNEPTEWIHVPMIPHCKFTLTYKTYDYSTYQCVQCENEYFLNKSEKRCELRDSTYKVGCLRLNLNSNVCLKCEYNFYLDQNGKCQLTQDTLCLIADYQTPTNCLICNDTVAYSYITTHPNYECLIHSNFDNELTLAPQPNWTSGQMNDCHEHHQCREDFLGNLDIELQKYLSCHVCKESTRIPFISLMISQNGIISGIKKYSMWVEAEQILSLFDEGKENKQSECFLTDFSEFNLKIGQNSSYFPSQCALGIFNSEFPLDMEHSKHTNMSTFNYQKANPFCGECKPGYKPVRNGFSKMVVECQQIQNCSSIGKQFSACDQCSQNYYFAYDSTNQQNGGIDRTQCIQSLTNHDPNCFVFKISASECHTCKDGFSKNHDGICEELNLANCQGKGNLQQSFLFSEFQLSYYRKQLGCTQCAVGYSKIYIQQQNDVCFPSTFSSSKNDSKYTSSCDYYKNDSSENILRCLKCRQGYIITATYSCIIKETILINCLIAQNSQTCSQCEEGYVLINGLCQVTNLEGCLLYVQNTDTQKCESCLDGYYLTSTQICARGNIYKCAKYTSQTLCSQCEENYRLVNLQNENQYCMPLNGYENNCSSEVNSLDQTQFQSNNIECLKCKSKYFLMQIESKKVCSKFNLIKYCTKYNRGSGFSTSTLKCIECRADRYLGNDQICHSRTVIDVHCLNYFTDKDLCQQCQQNYILNSTNMSCYEQPSGIQSCRVYSDETKCFLCNSLSYLKDNQCFSVEETKLKEHCTAYNDLQECTQCQANYSLESGSCIQNEVQNCLEFNNSKSCKVCEENFGLQANDNINTCISIQQIANCSIQSQVSPYDCLLCLTDFYPNGSTCLVVTTENLIKDCIQYQSENTCQKCKKNYILSVDKKECNLTYSKNNCSNLQHQGQSFCVLCEQGKQISTDLSCEVSPASKINGCYLTEFQNDLKCAICKFGYNMNENFICVPNEDGDQTLKEKPINEKNDQNGSAIIKVLTKVLMSITMIWML